MLEPDDRKLSRPVLKGPGLSNGVRLLDPDLRLFLLPFANHIALMPLIHEAESQSAD